jgi:hypothetical protein
VLLGTEYDERITVHAGLIPTGSTEVTRHTIIGIGDITIGTIGLGFENTIHEDPQPPVRSASLNGDMVPPPVRQVAHSTKRQVSRGITANTED